MEEVIDTLLDRLKKAERKVLGHARALKGTRWRAQALMRRRNLALRRAETARRALKRLRGTPEWNSAFLRWQGYQRAAANLTPAIVDTLRRNWR